MAESGTDQAAAAFQADMNPSSTPAQPRNERGEFSKIAPPVERLFEGREMEDDEGTTPEPEQEESRGRERLPESDDEEGSAEDEGEGEGESEDKSDESSDEDDGEQGPHYEVNVDGAIKQVSLKEALEGYIRTDTFHQRMNKLSEIATNVSAENVKNQQIRDHWIKRARELEGEYEALIPKEPDWDAEFAANPAAAHSLQKQFQAVKGKLDAHRQQRIQQEQALVEENKRRVAEFARMGQERFINENQLQDPKVREKEVQSMRRTALSHGFSEQEIAEVYDPRMLSILRKASKYDRIQAAKPKAVIPGKGKTLTPGSVNGAKPRSDRKGIDAAQRKLAASGRIDDAADFFLRVLK